MASTTPKIHASTLIWSYSGVMSIPSNTDALDTTSDTTADKSSTKFIHGTGAAQANNIFSAEASLAVSAHIDLVLGNGSLLNGFNEGLFASSIKRIIITNGGTDSTLLVGSAATNPVTSLFGSSTDKIKIRPGGELIINAIDAVGFAVVPGTSDQLRLTHMGDGSSPINYSIIIEIADSHQP